MTGAPEPSIYLEKPDITIWHGDALATLRRLPADSVDAVICDPPAGITFMGHAWDGDKGGREAWSAWLAGIMCEALRVVKPGGHALVWALPRTSHWTACGLEDAGWEIRDRLVHLFATGFPKGQDISKAIDRMAGADRPIVGANPYATRHTVHPVTVAHGPHLTGPATDEAAHWSGWNTTLKPAAEDWWLCRKPLAGGTVAANMLEHGTGALNIDACRVPGPLEGDPRRFAKTDGGAFAAFAEPPMVRSDGRWPPNVLVSHALLLDEAGDACADGCVPGCAVAALDEQSGEYRSTKAGVLRRGATTGLGLGGGATYGLSRPQDAVVGYGDWGGAARFFPVFRYEAKAPTSERPIYVGPQCDHVDHINPNHWPGWARDHGGRCPTCDKPCGPVQHSTIKSIALMRWLIRLITPPGGVVLDWCAGSGATGEAALLEGHRVILNDVTSRYLPLIEQRERRARVTPRGEAKPRLSVQTRSAADDDYDLFSDLDS